MTTLMTAIGRRRSGRTLVGAALGAIALAGAGASTAAPSYASGGPSAAATLKPSFGGGQLGGPTAIRLGLNAPLAVGELQEPWHVVVHLPKGTVLNFGRLPKGHTKPQLVGSARLEDVAAGTPQFVTSPVYLVAAPQQVGSSLVINPPPPFVSDNVVIEEIADHAPFAAQALYLSPFGNAGIVGLSVSVGSVKLGGGRSLSLATMPKSCPRSGFAWRVDYSTSIAPERSTLATSPCTGGSKAAAVSRVAHTPLAEAAQGPPATAFQCERRFHTSAGRTRCFSQLPGASCAHPLIAEKADDTTRGEHRYFRLGFHADPYFGPPQGDEVEYSYAPATSNVAMCPYPIGAVFKDFLLSDESHCEGRHHHGHYEEYCSSEYDTRNHPEPVGRRGGSFTFDLKSPRIGILVVKGYFIHPPWTGRG